MEVTVATLEARLRDFPGQTYVSVANAGADDKFHVIIVSDHFKGMPLLAQQRAVFKFLEEEMKAIHALTMKTWTVEKYAAATADAAAAP